MAKTSLLRLKNVSKFYYNKGTVASGFTKVNLELNLGEFVVITGESGSGKSTLLHVLSGLDTYEEGEMYINGEETSHYTEKDFEEYRKTYIGNIFQSFNLVNSYTVYQNIELVLLLNGYKKKEIKTKINELIDKVGLTKYRKTKVSKLSGGQKQRVAIARALAKDTPIIIADEPTGNLDSNSAKSVLKLLAEVSKDKLVVLVTHNYDQVEEYATRKLEMHDGKIREDSILKEVKTLKPSEYKFKDLTLINKVRLGFRNTFNIFSKFILTFFVFIFVITSFLSEYAGFKTIEMSDELTGTNAFFTNFDPNRIVVQKSDKTAFTSEDYSKLKSLDHVSYINKDDVFIDNQFNINDKDYNFSFFGRVDDINRASKVTKGRMPEKDNEIVVAVMEGDYYGTQDIYDIPLEIYNNYSYSKISFDNPLVIVGVIEIPFEDYKENIFYLSSNAIANLRLYTTVGYSKTSYVLNNKVYKVDDYDYNIIPTSYLSSGEAIVSNDMNMFCSYSWCKNKPITINTETIYFKDSIDLTIVNMYTKNNYKNLTGRDDFEYIPFNTIFISNEDFNKLYNKESYQSSIYVDDELNIDKVNKAILDLGYNTLPLKDNLDNPLDTLMGIFKILRVIVFVGEFVFLFFIAYVVIKLIQKSKNVYYATVRILGGSKKIVNDLIRAELLSCFHIAFIIVVLGIIAFNHSGLDIPSITQIVKYMNILDFVFIYVILLAMSLLISERYSRKLFKSSAMKSYREAV